MIKINTLKYILKTFKCKNKILYDRKNIMKKENMF